MGLADDTRVKVLLAGFLLSLFALTVTTALGLLAGLSALGEASPTAPLLFVVLDAAAPWVVASLFVGTLSFLLLVALSVAAVRRASMPRDERLARVARWVERHSPEARRVGLAERFEPTTEDRIEELKQAYVAGEITELEYERRLQDVMADDDVSDERVRRETRGVRDASTRTRTEREYDR